MDETTTEWNDIVKTADRIVRAPGSRFCVDTAYAGGKRLAERVESLRDGYVTVTRYRALCTHTAGVCDRLVCER